jgi:hypothetical protein
VLRVYNKNRNPYHKWGLDYPKFRDLMRIELPKGRDLIRIRPPKFRIIKSSFMIKISILDGQWTWSGWGNELKFWGTVGWFSFCNAVSLPFSNSALIFTLHANTPPENMLTRKT